LTGRLHRRADKVPAPARDWRRIHHSPWFWVGVAMFLTAILTYVFSEDLSLRPCPHLHGSTEQGRSLSIPPSP
jgi:hypothetical protein